MARSHSHLEIEIKLRIPSAAAARRLLRRGGFLVRERRVFERNTIFDTPAGDLLVRSSVLRLRQAGRRHTLTFKGAPQPGRHKTREEFESAIADSAVVSAILSGLNYAPVFRYEKYRTVYARRGQSGSIMLDETPIGDFLELEGPPRWIDRTARELGFTQADYITASYGRLYRDYCQSRRLTPRHMVFTGRS